MRCVRLSFGPKGSLPSFTFITKVEIVPIAGQTDCDGSMTTRTRAPHLREKPKDFRSAAGTRVCYGRSHRLLA